MNNRCVVAVSGGGRSLANLIEKSATEKFEVIAVIASTRDCGGVKIAQDANLPLFVGDFASPEVATLLQEWLQPLNVDWICLAGFLKKFPRLASFSNRVINIHPALLPAFGGKGMYGERVHRAVINAQEEWTGATIHYVSEDYDRGGIIAQIRTQVLADDTPESLARRVFQLECFFYPEVLSQLIAGLLPLKDGKIAIVEPA